MKKISINSEPGPWMIAKSFLLKIVRLGRLGKHSERLAWSVLLIVLASATDADGQSGNPRQIDVAPEISVVQTLDQNWTDNEANWFYDVPQGSRLMPYDWFVNLEQPESAESFLAADHIRRFGYIPRKRSGGNPDGLPIGFIKDTPYRDGTAGLGLTCAACHTGQINLTGTAYLIDGAPTLADFAGFQRQLVLAMKQTVSEDRKFDRFATRVLGNEASNQLRKRLRLIMKKIAEQRAAYNQRNLPSPGSPEFGHGRIDAFGAILNEVTAKFMGQPENQRPADAPVSYPCLWDAPQHEVVQWNGSAMNRSVDFAAPLFGTSHVGALGRNAGEVLGVFGVASVREFEMLIPKRYDSTINKSNLIAIEKSLANLWSPQWPFENHPIDSQQVMRGQKIFNENCVQCHQQIDRTSIKRQVTKQLHAVGTDQTMAENFERLVQTGDLENRLKTIAGQERLRNREPVGVVLKHVVERVILDKLTTRKLKTLLANMKDSKSDSLTPNFRNTAIIEIAEQEIELSPELLLKKLDSLQLECDSNELLHLVREVYSKVDGNPDVIKSLSDAGECLEKHFADLKMDHETTNSTIVRNATASFAYKARPLNGIWATAPYLHNGSVPNLTELLKAPEDRVKKFHVGSLEFDPINVGFMDDSSFPEFDTTQKGNSNAGHSFGVELSASEKLDLIEYLKSL